MKVRMVTQLTGTLDGVDYPRPGEVGEFPDAVANDLVAHGHATTNLAVVDEAAVVDEGDVETATTRRRRKA